jgi:hypothetical protein
MRYSKLLVGSVLFAGLSLTAAQARAAEWAEHRDLRNDYARAAELRNHIAADRARLNEALRCGRWNEANALRRDIARDEAALNSQHRDIRQDRRDRW